MEIIVIVALLALLGWERHQGRKERAKLLNAILAKDNAELVNLELADKTKIKVPKKEVPPDFMDTRSLPPDEYRKMIIGKKK